MQIYTYLLLVFLFFSSISTYSQTNASLGFKGGYSMATQYGIDDPDLSYTVDTYYRHGLAGGLMVFFPITESFGIQQELLYVMKGSREDITMDIPPVKTQTEYDLNYLEIPIVFKYTFVRLWDVNIYGSTGFALSILLNGESRVKGTINIEGNELPFSDSGKMEGVDIFDYSFLYGAGFEFQFLEKKCFFEYRFTIGWHTLMMPTFEGADPAPLRNQDYIFVLGFYL